MRRISLRAVALLAAAAALAPASASAASWTTQTTPEPAGALGSELNGVHCTATNACTGVGSFQNSSNEQRSLAERWNGTSWAVQSTPTPSGALAVSLSGVHCTGATACKAAGTYQDSGGVDRTLAMTWNGASWSQDTTPNPSGSLGAYLSGIHCSASNACTAVGANTDSGRVVGALAQRWNGSTWSTQTTPVPTSSTQTVLAGVACPASNNCIAVGYYVLSRVRVTLALHWNGSSWSHVSTPNPVGHAGSELEGISCTGTTACTAVGRSVASGVSAPLALRWNGTTWSLQTPPLPVGQTGGALSGVSCTTSTHCTAVGYSHAAGGALSTLAEVWNGTTWSVQSTPNPASSTDPRLTGVSCTSSAWCEATGWYFSGGQSRAFAEKWS